MFFFESPFTKECGTCEEISDDLQPGAGRPVDVLSGERTSGWNDREKGGQGGFG